MKKYFCHLHPEEETFWTKPGVLTCGECEVLISRHKANDCPEDCRYCHDDGLTCPDIPSVFDL